MGKTRRWDLLSTVKGKELVSVFKLCEVIKLLFADFVFVATEL